MGMAGGEICWVGEEGGSELGKSILGKGPASQEALKQEEVYYD